MKKIILLSVIPFSIYATNDLTVNVTAERVSKPLAEVTSSTIYLSKEDIENSTDLYLPELLNTKAGIQAATSGGPGQTSSLYIRGAKTEYTLVIIDGVKVNDPSAIGAQFDLRQIPLSSIESVEILKGPQTVLYGVDAVAGVIKITTRKSKRKESNLSFGVGSFETKDVSASTSGAEGKLRYRFSGSAYRTKGISAADQNEGDAREADGFMRNSFNGNLSYSVNNYDLGLSLYTIKSTGETDAYSSGSSKDRVDDDNDQYDQFLSSLNFGYKWSDHFSSKLVLSENKIFRTNDQYSLEWRAKKQQVELENIYRYSLEQALIFGGEFERDKISSKSEFKGRTNNKKSFYLLNQSKYGKLFSDQGIRIAYHKAYDSKATYKLGLGCYLSNNLIVKGSYGTSIKEATVDELYTNYGGNPNLEPTRSESFDLSVEADFEKHDFKLTYFDTEYKDQITYSSSTSSYENLKRSKTKGLEFTFESYLFESLRLLGSATILRAYNLEDGSYLARRARHYESLSLEYFGFDKILINLSFKNVGRRNESTGQVMPSYFVTDLSTRYDLSKRLSLSAKVLNVLDKSYQEVRTYGKAGRNYFLSADLKF